MYDTVAQRLVVPLLLRLALAVISIYHGWDLVGGEGHNWGTSWNPSLPPVGQAAVAWGELIGGLALAVGFLTRLAAAGIAVIMIGAIATVHWPNGFDLRHGGFEYNFAILVMCAALIVGGGGTWGGDGLFRRKRPPWTGAGPSPGRPRRGVDGPLIHRTGKRQRGQCHPGGSRRVRAADRRRPRPPPAGRAPRRRRRFVARRPRP